jgi:hypothetical protein
LLDKGFSIPGGVSIGVSFFLGIHTFFFFGVMVDLGASSCSFHTFFLEDVRTTFGDSFLSLGLFFFFYSGLLFFFLTPFTIWG